MKKAIRGRVELDERVDILFSQNDEQIEHTSFVCNIQHTLDASISTHRWWRPITCLDNNNNRNGISVASLLWEFHTLRRSLVVLFLFCWCWRAIIIAAIRRWFYLRRRKWLWSERDENFSIRFQAKRNCFRVLDFTSKQFFHRLILNSGPEGW